MNDSQWGKENYFLILFSPKFMIDIITSFSQYNKDFGIVAGDFNCCMNNNLDRTSSIASNPYASQAIKMASNDAGLVDIWREFNLTAKYYTFYSTRHKTYSRLDFFLLPQDQLSSVISCYIGPILTSDHSPVYLQLSLPQQTHQTKCWRSNSSFLINTDACNNIRQWLEQYRQDDSFPCHPCSDVGCSYSCD